MECLGFNIIKKGSDYYYNCNYKGYEFEVEISDLETEEITIETRSWNEYSESDGDGTGTGETHEVTENYPKMNNLSKSIETISDYWLDELVGSDELKEWSASLVEETVSNVDFYADVDAIRTAYPEADWDAYDDGESKIQDIIEKDIHTLCCGTLMTYPIKVVAVASATKVQEL